MRLFGYDVETFSAVDLKKLGSYLYTRHATTDVRCVAYCLVDNGRRGPVKIWLPGDPPPDEVVAIKDDPDACTCTFNDPFDRQIHEQKLALRHGWPVIPLERRRCAQAAALARALPAALDSAAAVLGIATRKSKEGIAIMRRLAGPRRQTAKERKAGKPLDFSATPEEMEILDKYARNDVTMMLDAVERIGLLPPAEQAIWLLNQVINERGVHVDIALLEAALLIEQQAKRQVRAEIAELTNEAVGTPGQRDRILAWLAEHGCKISNLRKATVADALREPGLNGLARRLLELRQDGAGTAALKFATLRRWTDENDERIHGGYRYHGASSGRFTSLGCQLHNLKKPELTDVQGAIAAVASGSLEELQRGGFARPLEVIGSVVRATITPAPGCRLFIADLSGIEARGAAGIVGASQTLAQWRTFDRSGKPEDEPYYITGISTFRQPPENARKAGKTGSLAFQYQGGISAYRRITGDVMTNDEVIAARRDAWRADHPEHTQFWGLALFQAVQAIRNPGTEFSAKAVAFRYDRQTGFLEMILPSGRTLSYPRAELIEDEFGGVSFTFLDASGSTSGRMYHERKGGGVFGGLLLENATQALCRDLFVAVMPELERAGYPIVMHTHDEWVCEVPDGHGSLEKFLTVVTTPPSWAHNLPIAAKARISGRLIEIPEPARVETIVTDNALANTIAELVGDEAGQEENGEDGEDVDSTENRGDGAGADAPTAPAPIAPPQHVCAHCLTAPDGSERPSAYEDAWLHPGCLEPFIEARMVEQGIAWEARASAPALTLSVELTSDSKPTDPKPDPKPEPLKTNRARNGNGSDELAGFDDFNAAEFLRPRVSVTPSPPSRGDDYPRGETPPPASGPAIAEYIYKDARGRLYMRVVRTSGKNFPTYHWSAGEWAPGWPQEVVPYRLPELLAAPADTVVLDCEGERDCDTAARYGFVATCNPGGAGKWQPELTKYFSGKQHVVLVQDNDDAGRQHTAKVAEALKDVVPTIGVVRFPELPDHGDLSDFFVRGGTKEALQVRIEEALKAGTARPYVIVRASEVELENVSWLWPGHLAHGALELLTGDPDLGKSQIHMSYAACVTGGTPWPDGFLGSQPQRVLLVTAEDNYANTVGPRAVAAGVDLSALLYLKGLVRNGKQEIFLLSAGLQELEQALLDHENIGLVLIDPITAYMGSPKSGRFDSHRATDVRSVLGPLKDLAERRRIAISAITHPPKGTKASPLDSYIGSQAYIAAARIGHLCIPETEPGLAGAVRNTGRMFFTQVKNNLGSKATTLAYHLDTKSIGFDRSGEPLKPAPYVLWEGAVDITSAEALAQARAVAKTRVNPVHEFLRDILASGPVLQKIIVERGAAKGISLPQLRRARKAIGAVTYKRRGGNVISPWLWALPEHVPEDVEREDESTPEGDA
jgi:DNA polymerase bacteriophage-type